MKIKLRTASFSSLTIAVIYLTTEAVSISLAFGALVAGITFVTLRSKSSHNESALIAAWPEVIDHLMSGIQSGLSLSESLTGLSTRGPEILRPAFTEFRNSLYRHGDVGEAINELKNLFHQHGSDQIFEALLISKALGGSELLAILRTLGDFLRQDLALRREIEVKHGWIKNSAHLSAAAPWILLLLLSTQPSTAAAYSTPTGGAILVAGLVMTAIAYIWMNRLGRLPQMPRVFTGAQQGGR
ncbi:MAG: type II secretion system protein F [Candidatus Planktophila sp.]|nr:type II secretion system protein F [Candidatus Planktophila sp.]